MQKVIEKMGMRILGFAVMCVITAPCAFAQLERFDELFPMVFVEGNDEIDDFYIGKFEVTQEAWTAVIGSNPSQNQSGGNYPVETVSWNDVQEFLVRLNALTGRNYRLPTSDEWLFAAKGGNQSRGYRFSGSNNIDDVAWYSRNSRGSDRKRSTHPVGTKEPNELGIYDMHGNVWEFIQGGLHPRATGNATRGQLRGGSFSQVINVKIINSVQTGAGGINNVAIDKGFRVAYTTPEAQPVPETPHSRDNLPPFEFSTNDFDVITLKNGAEIKAKVTEISATEIKYRLFEHLDGPVMVIPAEDVFFIVYANGMQQIFHRENDLQDIEENPTASSKDFFMGIYARPLGVLWAGPTIGVDFTIKHKWIINAHYRFVPLGMNAFFPSFASENYLYREMIDVTGFGVAISAMHIGSKHRTLNGTYHVTYAGPSFEYFTHSYRYSDPMELYKFEGVISALKFGSKTHYRSGFYWHVNASIGLTIAEEMDSKDGGITWEWWSFFDGDYFPDRRLSPFLYLGLELGFGINF